MFSRHLLLLIALFTTAILAVSIPVTSPAELEKRQAGGTRYIRITRPKSIGPPYLSGYLELGIYGDALLNKTVGAKPFPAALNPGPDYGKVWKRGTNERGFLQPLECDEQHYQLRFKMEIPNTPGILWERFTKQGRDCGGNCGGIDLRYNSVYGSPSTFFAVPHPSVENVWAVSFTIYILFFSFLSLV